MTIWVIHKSLFVIRHWVPGTNLSFLSFVSPPPRCKEVNQLWRAGKCISGSKGGPVLALFGGFCFGCSAERGRAKHRLFHNGQILNKHSILLSGLESQKFRKGFIPDHETLRGRDESHALIEYNFPPLIRHPVLWSRIKPWLYYYAVFPPPPTSFLSYIWQRRHEWLVIGKIAVMRTKLRTSRGDVVNGLTTATCET